MMMWRAAGQLKKLAGHVGMSRAAFAARFTQILGVPPMEYVLRWRMALAKDLLWHDRLSLGEVAHAIGYQSASAFSTAFSRSVGQSPRSFARTGRTNPLIGHERGHTTTLRSRPRMSPLLSHASRNA